MVLRKDEHLIKKMKCNSGHTHSAKNQKKYTVDPYLKKRQYDFYNHIQEMFYMTLDL